MRLVLLLFSLSIHYLGDGKFAFALFDLASGNGNRTMALITAEGQFVFFAMSPFWQGSYFFKGY